VRRTVCGHGPLRFPWLAAAAATAAIPALPLTPPAAAQEAPPADSVRVVPNPSYKANSFFRAMWGGAHRAAWTAEFPVPLLDLSTYSGGLTPTKQITGDPHKLLIFRDPDGRSFQFRSVSRDLAISLPKPLQGTFAELIVQEEVAAQYPVAPLVVDPLESATGVLHIESKLFSLPDDARLGKFRAEFAGMLGVLSRIADTVSADYENVEDLIDSGTLLDLTSRSPSNRVDAKALLRARLLDVYVGDFARRPSHWQWVLLSPDASGGWKPVAEDRDNAFIKLDGFFPSKAWLVRPELVGYGERFRHMTGLTLSGATLDRRFLSGLEWPAWDSAVSDFENTVNDSVILGAIGQLPDALQQIDSTWFRSTLQARGAALRDAAYEFYRVLAGTVEIQGTDAAETVRITELDDESIEVRVAERGRETEPYFRRRFLPDETREIRLRLRGGGDRIVVDGEHALGITLRVIAGRGADTIDFVRPARDVSLYDQYDGLEVVGDPGRRVRVDRKPYEEWTYSPDDETAPRQWGEWTLPSAEVGLSGDYGLFVGGGATRYWYGFRRDPYAARATARVGVSTLGKLEFNTFGDFRGRNTQNHLEWHALASSRKILRWYGLGNDTQNFANADSARVDRWLIAADVSAARVFIETLDLLLGPVFNYSLTGANEDRFISTEPNLYGNGDFAELGAFAELRFDNRDNRWAATKGFKAGLRGSVFPSLFDVESTYGFVDVHAVTYLTPSFLRRPTLALRAGSRKIWGLFPWFESAFIGGLHTVRGWPNQRFAGDASLYGSAEVRAFLFNTPRAIPGRFGGSLFVDTGRVYVDGDSPGGWHTGAGFGVWFALLGQPSGTFAASVAFSDEETVLNATYGFAF